MEWTVIFEFLRAVANIVAFSAIFPVAAFIYFYGTRPAYYMGDEKAKWYRPKGWKATPGKHKWYRRELSFIWRTTEIGRTLMYQKIAWLVFLVFAVVNLTAGDYFFREPLRLIIYVALVVLFWRVFYTLRRLQKSGTAAHAQIDAEQHGPHMHALYDYELDLGEDHGAQSEKEHGKPHDHAETPEKLDTDDQSV
jgi:hypothetical protein